MSKITKQNGRLEVTSQPERIGNVNKAIYNDEVVTLRQLSQYVDTDTSYKIYRAILTQTGTAAPVATILENTLGGVPVWTYSAVGDYKATLTGAFTANKTYIITGSIVGIAVTYRNTVSELEMTTNVLTNNAGVYTFPLGNNALFETAIEIRVYL